MERNIYELADFPCQDGYCLMIHEITHDSKLGALSPDHRDVGEAIVRELNRLSEMNSGQTYVNAIDDIFNQYVEIFRNQGMDFSEFAIIENILIKLQMKLKEAYDES